MKIVYTNESNILVNNAKNLLVNEKVSVFVKNEHVSTGAHPHLAYMELWVNSDSDYAKAKQLLAAIESQNSLSDWMCIACNEKNDPSFEICWNCSGETKH